VKKQIKEKKLVPCKINNPFTYLFVETSGVVMRGYLAMTTTTSTSPTTASNDGDNVFVGRQRALDTTFTNLGSSANFIQ